MVSSAPRPLLAIDAPSLYFRAFFAIPPRHAPSGIPINAAHGFVDWMARLVADRDPGRIACVMDADWRPAFRVDLLPAYKAQRVAEGNEPDELSVQVPVIEAVMRAAGIAVMGLEGYEADDVIATLCHTEAPPVQVVSGDRDLFQLVRDPDVRVLYPKRGVSELEEVDEAWVAARYAIPGRRYADFSILRGDPSDGLPGVRGVGEKTAAGLISRYGSLEAVMQAAAAGGTGVLGKVQAHREYLEAARKVVMLPAGLPLNGPDLARPRVPADPEALTTLARDHGLAGPIRRLVEALDG